VQEETENGSTRIEEITHQAEECEKQRASPARIGSRSLPHKCTGPRTPQGKQRSKRNGLKDGIFSKEILLACESPVHFRSLVRELQKDLDPIGALEGWLVNDLAILIWQKMRVLSAEAAAIRRVTEFVALDARRQQFDADEAQEDNRKFRTSPNGMLDKCTNPFSLDRAIQALADLRQNFEKRGWNEDEDRRVLSMLYGHSFKLEPGQFPVMLLVGVAFIDAKKNCPDQVFPEHLRNCLALFDAEIERIKALKDMESKRLEYTARASQVLPLEESERFLRQRTHLAREIERTLNMFEHRQRTRLSLPVPPTLKVKLSRE
jgi:hypothetical protein